MADDVLAVIPIFKGLSPEQRAALAALLKEREFPANRPVFWLGERGDEFYLVKAGKVTVSCPDEDGKEVILATLGPGVQAMSISVSHGPWQDVYIKTIGFDVLGCANALRGHPDGSPLDALCTALIQTLGNLHLPLPLAAPAP